MEVFLEITKVVFLEFFSHFLDVSNALIVEFSGAMSAIEFAYEKGWLNFWLESDSVTVVQVSSLPINCLGRFITNGPIVSISLL